MASTQGPHCCFLSLLGSEDYTDVELDAKNDRNLEWL